MNGTSVTIGGNHGHVLVVAKEDVVAGVDKSYNIEGTALHYHSVTITAAEFAQLAANTTITTESSFDGHSHTITVMCV